MRPLAGTKNLSSAGVAIQFETDSNLRAVGGMFSARLTNTGNVFIGTSSAVSSVNGIEISATEAVEVTNPFRPSHWWMTATDTAQLCDFAFELEN